MTPAVAALLALAVIDTVSVAPGRRAVVPLDVAEPSRIVCEFTLMSAGPGVRIQLVPRDQIGAGRRRHVLAATGFGQKGILRFDGRPGPYALVVDNSMGARDGAEVWIRVELVPLPVSVIPGELSSARRAAVVAVSLLFFIATGAYVLRRFRAALRDRKANPLSPV